MISERSNSATAASTPMINLPVLVVVPRPAEQRTFQELPRCWVVERTLGWQGRKRRLSKDYEAVPESSEA